MTGNMTGKLLVGIIALSAVLFGGGIYYFQIYGFYEEIDPASPAAEIRLTPPGGEAEAIPVSGFRGIDANSSPIRYRSCFTAGQSQQELAEAYAAHPEPVPLTAPGWFDCFDARQIGADIEAGRAVALMGEENITYGVDRVVAIYPDGRGYAWQQLNRCGEKVFAGDPPPQGCPPPPGRTE